MSPPAKGDSSSKLPSPHHPATDILKTTSQVLCTNSAPSLSAKKSIYGGLIASGWHTAALMMRIYSENYLSKVANLGSPGGDELRWDKPVFAGDKLSVRATVLETRRSESRPDRGIVRTFIEVSNQKREVVMSMKMVNLVRSRKA
jgi:acyl dehydratase